MFAAAAGLDPKYICTQTHHAATPVLLNSSIIVEIAAKIAKQFVVDFMHSRNQNLSGEISLFCI